MFENTNQSVFIDNRFLATLHSLEKTPRKESLRTIKLLNGDDHWLLWNYEKKEFTIEDNDGVIEKLTLEFVGGGHANLSNAVYDLWTNHLQKVRMKTIDSLETHYPQSQEFLYESPDSRILVNIQFKVENVVIKKLINGEEIFRTTIARLKNMPSYTATLVYDTFESVVLNDPNLTYNL